MCALFRILKQSSVKHFSDYLDKGKYAIFSLYFLSSKARYTVIYLSHFLDFYNHFLKKLNNNAVVKKSDSFLLLNSGKKKNGKGFIKELSSRYKCEVYIKTLQLLLSLISLLMS